MNGKMKMIAGIALALSVLFIAFLVAPIQAYANGAVHGDSLQTQDQDRKKTGDCDCNGDTLQTQEQERLGAQHCDCDRNRTQTQYHNRERTAECSTNRTCNCTMSMEQYRHKCREHKRSLGQ